MANILTATVTIEGSRTLLWHYFGPNAIPLERGERTGVAGNDPEEWRESVLYTKERQLYLEPTQIFGTVRDGARHTKKGRGSIQPLVVATLQIPDERILVNRFLPEEPIPTDPDLPVYMDIRSVKNPASKARNVRYRIGARAGWQAEFRLVWDKTVVARAQMEAALSDAGKLEGIGDGRKIGFGRFDVKAFDISEA